MVKTRARVGHSLAIIIGAILGGLIGAGLAFAGDDYPSWQDTVRREEVQAQQNDIRHKDQMREQYREETLQRDQQRQRETEFNSPHSYNRIQPDGNGGTRMQLCTRAGRSEYCQ